MSTSGQTGSQIPRINHSAPFEYTSGEDCAYLADSYGMRPDPWQADAMNVWLAEYKNTRLIHTRVALAVPRQNGKNGVLEMVELFKMVVQGRKVLHTAHEVKTARTAFIRLASYFENAEKYPEMAAMLVEIRRTNGQEAIVLDNGGSVQFIARSRGSGRGFTVDDLVMDEAQDLTDEQLEALLPTISAAPSGDPQQIYTGTPPGPRSPGRVFGRIRAQAVKGADRRLGWIEFSIPDEVAPKDAVKNWREYAYATNPALGVRLNIGTVQDEMRVMSEDGFARERLGQWDTAGAQVAINVDDWQARFIAVDDVPVDGRWAFGVKFSPDGAHVGLAGALRPADGPVHVEAIDWHSIREGTAWLVDFLLERKDKAATVAIDGKYGTAMLANELAEAGFPKKAIVAPRVEQVVAAHSMFEQAIEHEGLTTIEQEDVVKQITSATKRKISKDGGFGWAARDDGTVVLLDALTLAFWAARTTRRNPGRKVRAL
ncbi:hypothetical protein [Trueperella pyogenes]|uniref:hypothetical protein n=1 Tax=Trueperella pyogenes TaxID=1661 RepID=UPI0014330FE8|nr:hypothetical protein [Trueperella pyogenes]QIU87084.1 hypothetical protein HEP79_07585 [Trueperella pyogenes]